MNNWNIFTLVVISLSVGIIMQANFGNHIRYTNSLIEQCEKKLPRNKHCILVATKKQR